MEGIKLNHEIKEEENLKKELTNSNKIKSILKQIEDLFTTPQYAKKVYPGMCNEILSIIYDLENENAALKKENKELREFSDLMRRLP